MLPHSKEHLATIKGYGGTAVLLTVVDDVRHIVARLSEELVLAEDQWEIRVIQGKIRALTDLINSYSKTTGLPNNANRLSQ